MTENSDDLALHARSRSATRSKRKEVCFISRHIDAAWRSSARFWTTSIACDSSWRNSELELRAELNSRSDYRNAVDFAWCWNWLWRRDRDKFRCFESSRLNLWNDFSAHFSSIHFITSISRRIEAKKTRWEQNTAHTERFIACKRLHQFVEKILVQVFKINANVRHSQSERSLTLMRSECNLCEIVQSILLTLLVHDRDVLSHEIALRATSACRQSRLNDDERSELNNERALMRLEKEDLHADCLNEVHREKLSRFSLAHCVHSSLMLLHRSSTLTENDDLFVTVEQTTSMLDQEREIDDNEIVEKEKLHRMRSLKSELFLF